MHSYRKAIRTLIGLTLLGSVANGAGAALGAAGAAAHTATAATKRVTDPATRLTITASQLRYDSSTPAPAGKAFVVVHISVFNGGPSRQGDNSQFRIRGLATGSIYHAVIGIDDITATQYLGSGPGYIAPGKARSGDLGFEVPATHQKFVLLWLPTTSDTELHVPINGQ